MVHNHDEEVVAGAVEALNRLGVSGDDMPDEVAEILLNRDERKKESWLEDEFHRLDDGFSDEGENGAVKLL